jgi:hypothetical protein
VLHRPWPYLDRLVARMADSAMPYEPVTIKRTPRTGGMHASTVLREMHKRKKNDITEEQLAIYGMGGLAFEDRAELALTSLSKEADWPWHCFRPGEVEQDGIICSPDILLVPKGAGELREMSIKMTWKSSRGLPIDHEGENEFDLKKWGYYFDQSMTYATPLDTLGGVLFCFFVVGDYTDKKPKIHAWELDWSVQERAETWDEIQRVAFELQH